MTRAPRLPHGRTPSERRGRRFFEDVPPDPGAGFKPGLCAHCHSGPLLNQTNEFAPLFIGPPIPVGTRFQSVGVSEFNPGNNPVREFIFDKGTPKEAHLFSPDPGRALITGTLENDVLDNVNVEVARLRRAGDRVQGTVEAVHSGVSVAASVVKSTVLPGWAVTQGVLAAIRAFGGGGRRRERETRRLARQDSDVTRFVNEGGNDA